MSFGSDKLTEQKKKIRTYKEYGEPYSEKSALFYPKMKENSLINNKILNDLLEIMIIPIWKTFHDFKLIS